jgi:hypothetical protein
MQEIKADLPTNDAITMSESEAFIKTSNKYADLRRSENIEDRRLDTSLVEDTVVEVPDASGQMVPFTLPPQTYLVSDLPAIEKATPLGKELGTGNIEKAVQDIHLEQVERERMNRNFAQDIEKLDRNKSEKGGA